MFDVRSVPLTGGQRLSSHVYVKVLGLRNDRKQPRYRKRRQKDDFPSFKTLSRLFGLVQFVKWRRFFSPGLEFLRTLSSFKKRRENSSIYVHVHRERQILRFRVVVVKWTSKKCTKKRHARVELLFWLITAMNLLYFGMYHYLEGRVLLAAFSFPTSLTTITVGQVFLNSL